MKLNPLNLFTNGINEHNTVPKKPESTAGAPSPEQKTELYSKDASIAIKNIYGASIVTTKTELQKEADKISKMCPEILQNAKKIQAQCNELTKDDDRIKSYAKGMAMNARNLYNEAKIFENSSREGFFKISGAKGNVNLTYFEGGKLKKILMNVKQDGDKMYAEHSFSYIRDNVLYQRNAITKDNKTVSCDEEFFYVKGEFQKYDKGVINDDENDSREVKESRLYKNGNISLIAQDITEKGLSNKTGKIYYFDDDGFDAYVENQTEKAGAQIKATKYDYTLGALTNYRQNDIWANCKNNTDLEINFKNEKPFEAFVNSEMSMTSFKTANTRYTFKDFKPLSAFLGYVRTSEGTVTFNQEVVL